MTKEASQYYETSELRELGLARVGRNVRLHRSVVLIRPETVKIGDNCRIDAFGIITGSDAGIDIGRHVHIAAGVYVFGPGGVHIADFAGLSSRVAVYSANDDYSGEFLTGPTIPSDLTNVTAAPVRIGRHVVVGAGSIVLPGVTIGDGSAIGALSLVKHDVPEFVIAAGNPLQVIKSRHRNLIKLEQQLTKREQLEDLT